MRLEGCETSRASRWLHRAGRLRRAHVAVQAVVIGVEGLAEGGEGWMALASAGGRAVRHREGRAKIWIVGGGELGSSGRIDGRVEMSDTGWDIIREGKLF